MLKNERHNQIVQQLHTTGSVYVTELARTFQVNAVTIRRDLAELEKIGQLHRVHGGAVLRAGQTSETDFDALSATAQEQQIERRIAEAVARFIPDHSVIFLGPGALTRAVTPFLHKHTRITIITNALDIAWYVAQQARSAQSTVHTLHLIGGQAAPDYGLYGEEDALQRLHADMVIFEAGGLDAEQGLTHDDRNCAHTIRALLGLYSQTVALVAPERVGRAGAVFIAPASEVDVLISGREAPTPALWDLSELGVRIILT
ncbi:MAG: DeoR/GlpR transcriptional regulator [Anaerolineae bacterium]|nr:DeoR/GlpR transcriptional regulator [Anaerolineae bacterium]